jgi:secreted PhoX family phosphatase
MGQVVGAIGAAPARARTKAFNGFGELVQDPHGVIDLPQGFQYSAFSREGDALTRAGIVPSDHDGMAAFSAGLSGIWLVRNHEINRGDVDDGKIPVEAGEGCSAYDPETPGGTTTLLVGFDRQLRRHHVSLAGTLNNCAGGPTPWRTWLTCEESTETHLKPHGYVFEVDPRCGGNPEPIIAMGRFAHEAVAFDRRGIAYLTEDAGGPYGCLYRLLPMRPLGGRGSLHEGGALQAAAVSGVDKDLSSVQEPGTVLTVRWIAVKNVNPRDGEASVREQVVTQGATPIPKAEGVWTDHDGRVWFTSSFANGPGASNPSAAAHSGQIWRYDPAADTLTLVVIVPTGSAWDGPDNITASPHGFALACNDGGGDQYLMSIDEQGGIQPFAQNVFNNSEFAGATFSPTGRTLFVNIQNPGMTLAIWGPWCSSTDGY